MMKSMVKLFLILIALSLTSIPSFSEPITLQITSWSISGFSSQAVREIRMNFSATGQVGISGVMVTGWGAIYDSAGNLIGINVGSVGDSNFISATSNLNPPNFNGFGGSGRLSLSDGAVTGSISTGLVTNRDNIGGTLSFVFNLIGTGTSTIINGFPSIQFGGNRGTLILDGSIVSASIAEPATYVLLSAGLLVLKLRRRRE